jgi:exosortase
MQPTRHAVWWKGPIPRELLLAAAGGLVFALSPFTPNEHTPAAIGGALLALGILAWRLRRASPVWDEADPTIRVTSEQFLGAACLIVSLVAFSPTLLWLYREWTVSVWVNQHGIFLPFAIAWLIRQKLHGDRGPSEASAWGFLPLAFGLALSVLDTNAQSRYLAAVGLLVALPGLSLLLLGTRRTWAIRMPLALTVLMLPVPFSIVAPLGLRTLTARGVLEILHSLGFTALREGTLIQMPPAHNFVVADACSGANALWAAIAVALVLAVTNPSPARRLALIALAPLLAVGANVVRVTALVLLTRWLGIGLLDTPVHEATGVATFVGVLVPLLLVAYARPGARAR